MYSLKQMYQAASSIVQNVIRQVGNDLTTLIESTAPDYQPAFSGHPSKSNARVYGPNRLNSSSGLEPLLAAQDFYHLSTQGKNRWGEVAPKRMNHDDLVATYKSFPPDGVPPGIEKEYRKRVLGEKPDTEK